MKLVELNSLLLKVRFMFCNMLLGSQSFAKTFAKNSGIQHLAGLQKMVHLCIES